MATLAATAAVPVLPREGESVLKVHHCFLNAILDAPAPAPSGIVAHTYHGAVIVSGGVPTRDFDSLSDEEKDEVLAECPAFVDGVDGEMDTACF